MTRNFALLLCGALWAGPLHAQLDLLTLREAESLVELVPAVVAAQRGGDCPQLSASYWTDDELWIQARSSCGSTGGMLIGNYLVNRRTGAATTTGDLRVPVDTPEGSGFARQLIGQARGRVLSAKESACLALEAARSFPGWGGTDAHVSVEPFGGASLGEMRFTALRRSTARPVQSGRVLSVNPAAPRVRDDETGLDVMSGEVGSLISKLVAERAPLLFTDEDAISIAMLVPRVAAQVRAGCRLSAGGAERSSQALVGLSCGGKLLGDPAMIAVDLQSGRVTDAGTGNVLESPEAARLARQLLGNLERRRFELRKEVDGVCGPP